MVRTINIISRLGDKETDLKHFKHLLPLDVKTIIEPFGGSFAISRKFYKDTNKYNFHINDTDPNLFYIYNNYQEYIDSIDQLNDAYINKFSDNPFDKLNSFKSYVEGLEMNEHIKNNILQNRFIKGCMYKVVKSKNYNPDEIDILNKGKFTNLDYLEILNEYKEDSEAFVFIDPPYLFSDNSSYYSQTEDTDATEILIELLDFMKTCKCKAMIVINRLKILEWLYKDYIKLNYKKIYQIGKKKNIHIVCTNYDI